MSALISCLQRSFCRQQLTFYYEHQPKRRTILKKQHLLTASSLEDAAQSDNSDIFSDSTVISRHTTTTTTLSINSFQSSTPNTYRQNQIATKMITENLSSHLFGLQFISFKRFHLVIFGLINSLGWHIFIVSGFAVYKYGGFSVILSFIVCALSIIITGLCLSEFTSRVPTNGTHNILCIYKYIYLTNGEIFAFLYAMNTILYSFILSAINCVIFTGYFESFLKAIQLMKQSDINSDISLQYLFGYPINEYINIHFIASVFALIVIILCHKIGQKSVRHWFFNIFVIFVILSFVIICAANVSVNDIPKIWLHPCDYTDSNNCPSNANNSYLPFGVQGFFACCAINLLCFDGIHYLSIFTKYTLKPQKTVKHSIVATTVINAFVYIVILLSLLSVCPFQSINILSTYSSVFTVFTFTKLTSQISEILFSFAILLIITYYLLINLNNYQIIISELMSDGLLFKIHRIVLLSILVLICCVFDVQILIEFVAIINCVSNVLICGSILLFRYSSVIHTKYNQKLKDKNEPSPRHRNVKQNASMDIIDQQIMEMNSNRDKSMEWSHVSIMFLVWSFITVSFVDVFLIFYYDSVVINIWTFITVFLSIGLMYFIGVFVYLHHTLDWKTWISPFENNNNPIFLTPLCPYMPLFGIVLNCVLIASVNGKVHIIVIGIYFCISLLYYCYGFRQSKVYKRTQKQYLLNETSAMYKSKSMDSILGNNNSFIADIECDEKYVVE